MLQILHDGSLRNANFDSSLQSLVVPIAAMEITGFSTSPLNISSCTNSSGILSIEIVLPSHEIDLTISLSETELIGGIGIGLTGPPASKDSNTLKELNFWETFYIASARTMSQTVIIEMDLTKVSDL